MTSNEARTAARNFISSVTKPNREWSINTIEAHLPNGWQLQAHAETGDFFPLTISHVAAAILSHAHRA